MAYDIKIVFKNGNEETIHLANNPFMIGNVDHADFKLNLDIDKRFFIRIIKNIELNQFLILFNGAIQLFLNQQIIESNESYVWDVNTKLQIERECILYLVKQSNDKAYSDDPIPLNDENTPLKIAEQPSLLSAKRGLNSAKAPLLKKVSDSNPQKLRRLDNRFKPNQTSRRLLDKPQQEISDLNVSMSQIPIPKNKESDLIPPVQEDSILNLSKEKKKQPIKSTKPAAKKTSPVIQIAFIISLFLGAGLLFYSSSDHSVSLTSSSFQELANKIEELKKNKIISTEEANHFYRARFYETQSLGDQKRGEKAKQEYKTFKTYFVNIYKDFSETDQIKYQNIYIYVKNKCKE